MIDDFDALFMTPAELRQRMLEEVDAGRMDPLDVPSLFELELANVDKARIKEALIRDMWQFLSPKAKGNDIYKVFPVETVTEEYVKENNIQILNLE